MRQVKVLNNKILAGVLREENKRHFTFQYDDTYFQDPAMPAISLTLPKTKQVYESPFLFPFFANMLSEGSNRRLQSIHLRIDENDDFGITLSDS